MIHHKGFCGVTCARMLDLDPRFYVILIDTKEFFEFTPSVLKAMVKTDILFEYLGCKTCVMCMFLFDVLFQANSNNAHKIRIPHTCIIKNGKVIIGEVIKNVHERNSHTLFVVVI